MYAVQSSLQKVSSHGQRGSIDGFLKFQVQRTDFLQHLVDQHAVDQTRKMCIYRSDNVDTGLGEGRDKAGDTTMTRRERTFRLFCVVKTDAQSFKHLSGA